jgi:hypothetical protein
MVRALTKDAGNCFANFDSILACLDSLVDLLVLTGILEPLEIDARITRFVDQIVIFHYAEQSHRLEGWYYFALFAFTEDFPLELGLVGPSQVDSPSAAFINQEIPSPHVNGDQFSIAERFCGA